MNKILIFYGSKDKFADLIPREYRSLTDLAYEFDKTSKIFQHIFPQTNAEKPEEEIVIVDNFVATSDEYAGVQEHVIMNFASFLSKFEVDNLYLHNPPMQISEQIKRLYPKTEIVDQKYKNITKANLRKLNQKFDATVIGQENAKLQIIQSLFPLTLRSRKKPVVLLLYGKSGIGKTETAKLIADVIGEPLFRKQFSMYQNSQFATYLFGGAHNEKSFAKDLLDRKSNVILLDEFDKAHPSFHSAFYQLFDEGIYEDQNYNLKLNKSIIICTSNYANPKEIEKELGGAIYNRFDNIIHYEDLSNEAKTIIGDKLYEEYQKKYRIQLDSVIERKLKEAYSRCENVRQISRLIEDTFAQVSVLDML